MTTTESWDLPEPIGTRPPGTQRFRVTVRGDGIELRGYIDGVQHLNSVARATQDLDQPVVVVASPAPEDYNPFKAAT